MRFGSVTPRTANGENIIVCIPPTTQYLRAPSPPGDSGVGS